MEERASVISKEAISDRGTFTLSPSSSVPSISRVFTSSLVSSMSLPFMTYTL